MTPLQSWISRYLTIIDPTALAGYRRPSGPMNQIASGVLPAIIALQSLAVEGKVRGFIENEILDEDLVASGYAHLTAQMFVDLVSVLSSLNATLSANDGAIMKAMYSIKA